MKFRLWVLTIVTVFLFAPTAHAVTCTPTGFAPDGPNLTAALINPASVPTSLDATGCDIGVYYHLVGAVFLNAKFISGAKSYGIVVNGDDAGVIVSLTNNVIHDIGDNPFTGAQHGIGIYLRAYGANIINGQVTGNVVYNYQKAGIVANGSGVRLSKLDANLVVGLGHVNFIAQNGIQIGYGALPFPSQVNGNWVVNNSYIGTPGDGSASAGILVVGGPYYTCPLGACPYTKNVLVGIAATLTEAGTNVLLNNDVGIFSFNAAVGGATTSPTPTNVLMIANALYSDLAYNAAYIAAISAFGHSDYIVGNTIVPGGGYGPSCGSLIDTSGSTNAQVYLNTPAICTATPAAAPVGRLIPSPSQ